MRVENHQIVAEAGDAFQFRFIKSPNFKPQLSARQLVIHATEGSTVAGAIGTFLNGEKSVHLILGKDGRDLVQMVAFNNKAVHAHDYNNSAIGIELDYSGLLTGKPGNFNSLSRFEPGKVIYAMAENDWRVHPWPLYPPEQLDTLLVLTRFLMENLGLTEIIGHEEINEGKRDPGPAFPMNNFRERILGTDKAGLVLEETNRKVSLMAGPPAFSTLALPVAPLPARTPVIIVGEEKGWALVEVMTEVDGNRWLVGWLDASAVQAKRFVPVIKDNLLHTSDGRLYRQIRPFIENYDPDRKIAAHKYAVMHITTGTTMQSTINWFRNPASEVSSHLLIGRDGRVVQFVPFDQVAFHAGDSHWEGDSNLNQFSIGIELDNAGFLSQKDGVFLRKGTVIPAGEVEMATHWKEFAPRPWQKFTDIQIAVTADILRVLKATYGIGEMLGHDVVNLRLRSDPGPLFPMEAMRLQVFGRRKAGMRLSRTTALAELYDSSSGEKPNLDFPVHKADLPLLSGVKILETSGPWALVKVLSSTLGGLNGAIGWIPAGNIKHNTKMNKTTNELKFFKKVPGANVVTPPILHRDSPLPAGALVRIQERFDDWTLVAVLEPLKNRKWLEGWVKTELLQEV